MTATANGLRGFSFNGKNYFLVALNYRCHNACKNGLNIFAARIGDLSPI
jgi:hypothetical protein